MATRNLLLLPGDGIGPEAMAEVKKLITAMNAKLGSGFTTEEGLVGGSAYDAHGQAISEADMAKAMAADAVLFGAGRRPEVGCRALRGAPRGRPAAPAQGPGAVRQPAPGDLLPGARLVLVAQAPKWSRASTS
jgi:hypothetical protein